jgi:murein DD-endopeptidase MepM/ murein hydrolase activator NlpD
MQILIIFGPNSSVKSVSFNWMKLLIAIGLLMAIGMIPMLMTQYLSSPELPLANHPDKKGAKVLIYQDINHANEFKLMTLQAKLESAENRLNQLQQAPRWQTHQQAHQIEGSSRPPKVEDHFEVRLDRALVDSFSIGARLDRMQDPISPEWEYARLSSGIPPLAPPLELSSQGGARIDPFTHQLATHGGIDLKAKYGDAIFATADGVVLRAGWDREYGYVIDLVHADKTITRYAHAQEILVRQGDPIKRAQVIARVGSTGRSTGPHLHYEVLKTKKNLMRG